MTITREQAAEARAAATAAPADRPSQRRCAKDDAPTSRGRIITLDERSAVEVVTEKRNGLKVVSFKRYASITERAYEMWDEFGPYDEVVSGDAFGDTLSADPLVEFSPNHGRTLPMAHTRNGTLDLGVDDTGLHYQPFMDPRRSDVQDLILAVERGDAPESSFKFRITRGQWSPDFSQYRINRVDLNRGDVSLVNFGANPFTADYTPRSQQPIQRDAELDGAHPVTPRQKALYDALEGVAETFGQFDQSSGPDGAHYMAPSPFAGTGMACGNCAFFDGARACEIVAGDVAPDAVCKFWVIPADLLSAPAERAARNTAFLKARLALALADN